LIKEGGYEEKEAIGILIYEPLERWPKVVKRLLEAKNKK
jgi:hypothetical protein